MLATTNLNQGQLNVRGGRGIAVRLSVAAERLLLTEAQLLKLRPLRTSCLLKITIQTTLNLSQKSTFTPSTYSFGRLIHWQLRSDYEFCVSEACRTLTIGCVTSVQLRMECVDILEHWEMYLINKNKRPKPNKYEPCHLSTSAQKHKIILYFWNTLTHITVSKFYALNVLKNALCIYGINACLFLCHIVWIYGQFAWCKLKKKKKKKSTHLVQQPRWQGTLGQLALAGYELCLLSVYETCTKFPIGGMYATVAQAL